MRRLTALATLLVLVTAVGPVAAAAPELPGGALIEVRAAWLVADGAGAEVRLRVTCHRGSNPTILEVTLASDRFEPGVARAVLNDPPVCTGEPERVVVPLAPTGAARITPGTWRVQYGLNSCIDLPDCWNVDGGTYRELQRAPFATPTDDDLDAELTLVRTRLTGDGDLRVVYDLTCRSERYSLEPLASVVYQAVPDGSLVVGAGQAVLDPDLGGTLWCDAEPRRLRYLVAASGESAFQPGRVYLHTTFGQWYEWLLWATDSRVVRVGAQIG